MRLLPALVIGVSLAAVAHAGPKPLWLILPPVSAERQPLMDLAQTEATRVLVESGQAEIHLKQILRVAERQGLARAQLADPAVAARMRRATGADAVVFARLDGVTLHVFVQHGEAAPRALDASLPTEAPALVAKAAALLAAPAMTSAPTVPPLSASAPAIVDYAACQSIVMEQPVAIENPTVLRADEIGRALKACRAAVAADPKLEGAWAALGLALALAREDKDAVQALLRVDPRHHLPLYTIGRYWLGTRYHPPEVGEAVLRQAIARRPQFLLARGYLVEHLSATDQLKPALAAVAEYEALAPRNPFLRGRRSVLEARAGNKAAAIASAQSAVALDPGNSESLLELASRYLDADKLDDCIKTLEPIAGEGARAEIRLRLAWALWRRGDPQRAKVLLEQVAAATEHDAQKWRTHARALTDLARIHAALGENDKADEALTRAYAAGHDDFLAAQKDDKLQRRASAVRQQIEAKRKAGGVGGPRWVGPPRRQELSPFSISPSGDLDPRARQFPTPPPALELLRF